MRGKYRFPPLRLNNVESCINLATIDNHDGLGFELWHSRMRSGNVRCNRMFEPFVDRYRRLSMSGELRNYFRGDILESPHVMRVLSGDH